MTGIKRTERQQSSVTGPVDRRRTRAQWRAVAPVDRVAERFDAFNVQDVLTAQEADDLGLTSVMDGSGNVTIIDILLATSAKAADGLLYDVDDDDSINNVETRLRTLANAVFTAINEGSDI